jgi:hypothetical protein
MSLKYYFWWLQDWKKRNNKALLKSFSGEKRCPERELFGTAAHPVLGLREWLWQ